MLLEEFDDEINAPVTMESYYDAWVKYDMAAGNAVI